ncbi:mandelate racemase/muconate lactonizing enzyme family protein [Actinokineospora guangxiensis]|uniref:Mandelate racemase/muconate lactonizing enzyme family protein n=1 Tax=Actinokineospora guangxiensis TaxID=1490288 RepID=A0ABW0EU74_9PSEU
MGGPVIADLRTTPLRAPLRRPWGPDVTSLRVVAATIADSAGGSGVGFSWTPSAGASAVRALLETDVRAAVSGLPAEPEPVWDRMRAALADAGAGGVTTMAMAAVDIALWDLRARRAALPLVELIGRRRTAVPVYGSGVNLHCPVDELVEQVRRQVDAGYAGVKIKVGPGVPLMIDANQRWDLPAALRAVRALAAYEPHWIEEPLPADDLRAHAALRARCAVPVAIGENLHTAARFAEAIRVGACDIVQPNVVRVGGITPFRAIAALASAAGVGFAPHLLLDLVGQLAMTLPQDTWVEDVEDADFAALGLLAAPSGVRVADGVLTAHTGPGHGLRFREPNPEDDA